MIRKKSNFLTFCFSFLPGAGQMYMGFMKRGISLMSGFFFLIFLTYWLEMSLFVFGFVVLWFYAFFDTFNLRSLPDDEFYTLEDDFVMFPGLGKESSKFMRGKYRNILAIGLIFIGFVILWNNIVDLFDAVLPEAVLNVFRAFGQYFPQLLFGFAIIALGIRLILGKKKELDAIDDPHQLDNKEGYQK